MTARASPSNRRFRAELAALMTAFAGEKLEDGRARLVRHGDLPEREVMTGFGPVPVTVPRVRDRQLGADKISFTPSILPRYLRKAKSVEEMLPWLYLKGLSTGDFSEALASLLGPNAKGLSATTITQLKADWWSNTRLGKNATSVPSDFSTFGPSPIGLGPMAPSMGVRLLQTSDG